MCRIVYSVYVFDAKLGEGSVNIDFLRFRYVKRIFYFVRNYDNTEYLPVCPLDIHHRENRRGNVEWTI